jgi:multidrug resistance efflux pump
MKTSFIHRMILLSACLFYLAGCQKNSTQENLTVAQFGMQSPESNSEIVIEGRVVPYAYMTLSFATPGQIGDVLVLEGQPVQAGQVIARLADIEQANAAIRAAEMELLNAQQNLQILTDDQEAVLNQALVTFNAARQAVNDAQTYLDSITGDRLQNEIAGAKAQLVLAENQLENATDNFDEYKDEDESNTTRATYRVLLTEAQRAYDEARRQLDNLQGDGYNFTLQQAKTTLEAATIQQQLSEEHYSKFLEGPDQDMIAAAEARLIAAEASLAAAQSGLEQLELRSPITGILVKSQLKIGEMIIAGQPLGTLADLSSWYVETVDLTEIDVVAVNSGQTVQVIADALPEMVMTGTVTKISESYQEVRGNVTYSALIKLEQADSRLRWGMTVLVTFSQR